MNKAIERQGQNFFSRESASFLKAHAKNSVVRLINVAAAYMDAGVPEQGLRPAEEVVINNDDLGGKKGKALHAIINAVEACNAECDEHGIGPLVTGLLDEEGMSEDISDILDLFVEEVGFESFVEEAA